MALRIIAGLIGLLFFGQGVNWIANPAAAAEGLGMPLLDGLARSTQVGDMAAFFVGLGSMILLGAYRQNAQWLHAGALLLALAAVMRTLAWLLQDAAFATEFIAIESIVACLLVFVGSRLHANAEPATQ